MSAWNKNPFQLRAPPTISKIFPKRSKPPSQSTPPRPAPPRKPTPRPPTLREALTAAQELAKQSATRPKRTPDPDPLENESLLERRKLRAILALYHQAANFVTPETLDQRIDQEFGNAESLANGQQFEMQPKDLDRKLLRRAHLTAFVTTPPITNRFQAAVVGNVEESIAALPHDALRSARLAGTLFGTDEHGNPSLEAIEEAIERDTLSGGLPNRRQI